MIRQVSSHVSDRVGEKSSLETLASRPLRFSKSALLHMLRDIAGASGWWGRTDAEGFHNVAWRRLDVKDVPDDSLALAPTLWLADFLIQALPTDDCTVVRARDGRVRMVAVRAAAVNRLISQVRGMCRESRKE